MKEMKRTLALLSLSVLLASCGGGGGSTTPTPPATTPTPTPATATTISGRVVNNHSGVDSFAYTIGSIHRTANIGVYMGDASAFELPLPSDAEMVGNVAAQNFETADCPGVVTVSDLRVQTYELGELDALLQGQPNGGALNGNVDEKDNLTLAAWIYADRPTTVTGSETCARSDGTSTKYTYNLNLVKGWNTVTLAPSEAIGEVKYTTQALGTPTEWYWYDKFGDLGGCTGGC